MNIYFIVFFNVIKFCLLFCRMLITFFLLKTNCLYKEQWFKNWYFHLHIFKYLISYFFFFYYYYYCFFNFIFFILLHCIIYIANTICLLLYFTRLRFFRIREKRITFIFLTAFRYNSACLYVFFRFRFRFHIDLLCFLVSYWVPDFIT